MAWGRGQWVAASAVAERRLIPGGAAGAIARSRFTANETIPSDSSHVPPRGLFAETARVAVPMGRAATGPPANPSGRGARSVAVARATRRLAAGRGNVAGRTIRTQSFAIPAFGPGAAVCRRSRPHG